MVIAPLPPTPWEPHVGDPTFIGWLITAAYAIAFVAAVLAGRADRSRERNLWSALAVGLFLLGVNKQLDLQTPFLAFGHRTLVSSGLLAWRRVFRVLLLVAVAAIAALVALGTLRLVRRSRGRYRLALLGIAGLALFVVLRASAFDHVGNVVGRRVLYSKKLAAGLELGSLVLIVVNAAVVSRRARAR